MSEQSFDVVQNKKNRKIILGIFGIPALIFLLSSGLYYLVNNKVIDLGTVNNGQLIIPPLQFSQLPLSTIDGQPFDFSKPEPKWAFVVFAGADCTGSCKSMLYIARQSNIALAKKMGRVRLMYVTTDGRISESLKQRFDREYIGMDVVVLSRDSISDMFADSGVEPFQHNSFYVVDPRGWLMMYYQVENTEQQALNTLGKAVVRDMKRLIK